MAGSPRDPSPPPPSDLWEDQDTRRWLATADVRERNLAPMLDLLMEAARLRPGERVLDVGCGTGPTTAAAACAVRPGGSVLGLDLAAELVAAARARVDAPEVDWLVADAATAPLPAGHFDAVVSRFGTMFFADPPAAFAHLARSTRGGGRLAMTVWPQRTEIESFTIAYDAAARALERTGAAVEHRAPDRGPYSMADPVGVTHLLTDAGWTEVSVERRRLVLPLGGPEVDPAEVARRMLTTGPAASLLDGAADPVLADAARDLAGVLAERVDARGLAVGSLVQVVCAVRPAVDGTRPAARSGGYSPTNG